MQTLRPSVAISITGIVVVGLLIGLGLVPLFSSLTANRELIDDNRLSLATVQRQQRNVDTVAKSYETIEANSQRVGSMFLNEQNSVAFFGAMDDVFADLGIEEFQFRIDSPNPALPRQLISFHVSFTGTYAQLITYLRRINTQPVLTVIQNVNISQTPNGLAVTLDGQLPWRQAI